MKGICLVVLLTIRIYVLLAIDIERPQCFHFTWPGAGVDELNCTAHNENNPRTPCMQYYNDTTKPNTTKIWENRHTDNGIYFQPMIPGHVCIRYSYIYSGAVINVSYFRGKVTEDQVTSVKSGCYVQYTEGYSIEVCVCQSKENAMPCNSTIRNTNSILITFVTAAISLFIYKIFDIP
ncbi:uncharacterized protein LOC105425020 [Pogonomyrmex barbatus]|uniref:Uncharacterized protein LOC105425020 n=1 Tax=Pogonomyrmex barbatus TaxID=144034 RepID=A0A6I9W5N6_9HYME|nr:uncharacterized protein LOC105425020 [Pogonomyrmex barbatus]